MHACGKPLYEEENIVYSVFSSFMALEYVVFDLSLMSQKTKIEDKSH